MQNITRAKIVMSKVSNTCVHDIYKIIIIVGANCHFQQYFSYWYITIVSCIGVENQIILKILIQSIIEA